MRRRRLGLFVTGFAAGIAGELFGAWLGLPGPAIGLGLLAASKESKFVVLSRRRDV